MHKPIKMPAVCILVIALIMNAIQPVFADDAVTVIVNNATVSFDQPPVITDGVAFVPIRAVCEKLGADVYWDGTAGAVAVVKNNVKLIFRVGQKGFIRLEDGAAPSALHDLRELEAPPRIIGNRALMPIGAVCDALGVGYRWDEPSSAVSIACGQDFIDSGNSDRSFANNLFSNENGVEDLFAAYQDEIDKSMTVFLPVPPEYTYDELISPLWELAKKTGIKVKYETSQLDAVDMVNIMFASDCFNDITIIPSDYWLEFYKDSFVQLDPYLATLAPNFAGLLGSPQIRGEAVSDDGHIYGMPMLYTEPAPTSDGIAMNAYYIRNFGAEIPQTIDGWYKVLQSLQKDGATAPLVMYGKALTGDNAFLRAYGIAMGFYEDNGVVKFGAVEPAYQQYLTEMAKWYAEGLIDPQFFDTTDEKVNLLLVSGEGAVLANKPLRMILEDFPAAPVPAADSNSPRLALRKSYLGGVTAYVAKDSPRVEEAVKWLDYFYSSEGSRLMDSLPWGFAAKRPDFPGLCDLFGRAPYNSDSVKKEADTWYVPDEGVRTLPRLELSINEMGEYNSIMRAIDMYVTEFSAKIIMGMEPPDRFADYAQEVKENMNLGRALAIEQAALDRR